ncbi:SpaH/EbpB family LPXTG-anchored major pilin [Enorma massiliensis]|uniref:SpaH/EbpB family LPXTG-anchored major pilin n=1 Tax=Enorma massiliensis TaxID=1472761 RepID=UPI00195907F5|nr:SpaH/EbpB family LPXTG-anchored major pilin [Enorma massiliensis]MBM6892769.1 SpaH/EbpB family LPXTG-anchored major pilin [Enorma massiliensis]
MLQSIGKKLMVALATMAMVVGSLLTTTPAFAAGANGSIAVTGNDGFEGITVYRMFDQKGDGESAKYVLNEAWNGFFTAGTTSGGIGLEAEEGDLSDAAYTYVKGLGQTDDKAVSDFAKKAAAWAASQSLAETSQANVAEGTKTATVSGLDYGYYLVVPNPKGSTDQTDPFRGTDAMLVNVNSGTPVKMELKTVYPTVDKKVEDNANHASASVGDTLDFTLTSTVPDISEYTKGYQFAFVDTLSKGLTFNENSVVVKINGNPVNATDYHVSTDGQILTINFGVAGSGLLEGKYDATSLFTGKTGQKITVTYKATLNENAVVATDELNTVKVVYSNDPTTDGTGESGESKTHQYTFGFDLNKTDGTNGLAGARFQLMKGDDAIRLIPVAGQENTYRPAKDGESEGVVDTVTTPEGGLIHFTGLAEGTYQLVETAAPEGYNKVADPIDVKIEATYHEDGTLDTWTVNTNGQNAVEVVNHAGTLLPGTGGIGTVLFTVVGVAIVVCGAVWYVRRSKANS